MNKELIELLQDVSQVDIGWNFGLLRERATKLLNKINSQASNESLSVRENEVSKEDFENLYPKYKCPKCGDWFHMPYKYCKCKKSG